MRSKIVIGNWKMHGSRAVATQLAGGIAAGADRAPAVTIAVCPPYVLLPATAAELAGSPVVLGAQNVSEYENGAYTGEISAEMLADLGCSYVIVGHSERRQLFGETSEQVARKLMRARGAGLRPVLCVGETLDERRGGTTERVVGSQLAAVLALPAARELLNHTVVAYEPVWAIGTGETATPEQAQAVHVFIRREIERACGHEIAARLPLLYGGSVKPGNAAQLFAMPDIDGGLIGGAALSADDFLAICNAAQAISG